MRQDDAAEWAHEVAGGKDPEGLDRHEPFRHVGRKEQLADDRREEDEDDEVVELKRTSEGREA